MFKSAFAVLLLSFVCVCAEAQTNLPSAPAPVAPHPDFSMPAATPHTATYAPPSADTPPPASRDTFCTAPSDGASGFRTKQHLTPFEKGELRDFSSAMVQRLGTEWFRHMPRAASDPWIRGATVLLRFEITPNGAIHDPVIMMSSGRHDYDDHVLRALIAAQPYPLPDGFTQPLRGCINFRYNVNREDQFTPDPLTPKPHKTHP